MRVLLGSLQWSVELTLPVHRGNKKKGKIHCDTLFYPVPLFTTAYFLPFFHCVVPLCEDL